MPPNSTGNRASNWRGSMMEILTGSLSAEVFLARLKLARGDVRRRDAILAQADQTARQHNFVLRMPEIAAAQVLDVASPGRPGGGRCNWPRRTSSPSARPAYSLAQGDPTAALAVLEPLRQEVEAKGWPDERLKVMVLQAVALQATWREGRGCTAAG